MSAYRQASDPLDSAPACAVPGFLGGFGFGEGAEADEEVTDQGVLTIALSLAHGDPAANLIDDADEADEGTVEVSVEVSYAEIVELCGAFHGGNSMHILWCN